MRSIPECGWIGLMLLVAVLPAARAQQGSPHIGYVYPAGGRTGTTFEVAVGGQFLTGLTNVLVSGGGVEAVMIDLVKPITGKELNDLRIQVDDLLARKAVVQNDFKALENFRSFKNAKTDKGGKAVDDKELDELKKKYANATWADADDKLLLELRKKIGASVRRPENPAISEIATLRLTVAADARPGDREIRVGAPRGLSNPMLFKVGLLPESSAPAAKSIQEKRFFKEGQAASQARVAKEKAETRIALPAVVNGQILPGAADRYRFAARKGLNLVIIASARELVPYLADAVPGWFQATLALYNSAGKEVAYDDDYRFNPDPVLHYEIPADDDYVLEIRDSIYRGREDFVYRITIGELPFITSVFPLGGAAGASTMVALKGWNLPAKQVTVENKDRVPGLYPVSVGSGDRFSNLAPFAVDALPECLEKEPNSQRRTAQSVSLPVVVNGRIDHPEDRDFFKFEGKAGEEIVAEVHARRLNSPLDSKLVLSDANGKQLAANDDFEDKETGLETHHADSYLRVKLPASGTYFVELMDTQHQGGEEYGYRLRLSHPMPDFTLRIVPSSINLRVGGTVPVTLYALRHDGFTNAISISLKDAPAGFSLSGASIPATQNQMRVTLTAPVADQKGPIQLHVEGRATIGDREVRHPAVPAEDMMQAFAYRHLVTYQDLCVGVGGVFQQKAAVKILSALPVKIPAGGLAEVKLNVPTKLLENKIELELSDPPDGITLQKVRPSAGGTELVLAAEEAKVGVGQKGNLIISAFMGGKGNTEKGKDVNKARYQVTTLPAIPFEIVRK